MAKVKDLDEEFNHYLELPTPEVILAVNEFYKREFMETKVPKIDTFLKLDSLRRCVFEKLLSESLLEDDFGDRKKYGALKAFFNWAMAEACGGCLQTIFSVTLYPWQGNEESYRKMCKVVRLNLNFCSDKAKCSDRLHVINTIFPLNCMEDAMDTIDKLRAIGTIYERDVLGKKGEPTVAPFN